TPLGENVGRHFDELSQLNLKTVAQSEIHALSFLQAAGARPLLQVFRREAEPDVAAGLLGPVLIVQAELRHQQHASRLQAEANVVEQSGGGGGVVQHHVQYSAVKRVRVGGEVACIALNQADVIKLLLADKLTCLSEHLRAVVQ